MQPVDGGDHKGPLLDGDTLHGAVLVAAAYDPAGEWEGWGVLRIPIEGSYTW